MLNTCVWPSLMYVVSSSASAAHGPPGIVCSVCADAVAGSVARSRAASSAANRSIRGVSVRAADTEVRNRDRESRELDGDRLAV